MAKRSDFAQKLLDDLRLRKERMAASQNSNQSNQVTIDAYSHAKQNYKGFKNTRTSEMTGPRTGNARNNYGRSNKSYIVGEASSQIVPYARGQSSEKLGNLSLALAFAVENTGKIRIDSSSRSSMLGFLQQIGTISTGFSKADRKSTIGRHMPSKSEFPILSIPHIEEISKGTQKLNQILQACSNGINFDRYSIEIGKELLKGAIDLEDSLRMLVNMQEASEHIISPQKNNRIKLLEDGEDDEDNTVEVAQQWQLDLPKFSFDKHSRQPNQELGTGHKQRLPALREGTNYSHERQRENTLKSVSQRRSASHGSSVNSLSTFREQNNQSRCSESKLEKARIPNVIAKLMGLDEIPEKDNLKNTMQDSLTKQKNGRELQSSAQDRTHKAGLKTKVTESFEMSNKQKMVEINKNHVAQDFAFSLQTKKGVSAHISFEEVIYDEKSPWRNLLGGTGKIQTGQVKPTGKKEILQTVTAQFKQNSENQMDNMRKERDQDAKNSREYKGTSNVILKEMLHPLEVQARKRPQSELTLQEKKSGLEENKIQIEKRHPKLPPISQLMSRNNQQNQQPSMIVKSDPQQKKHREEEKKQQRAKKNLQVKKQKGSEMMSRSLPKPIHDAINFQKKQLNTNQAKLNKKRPFKSNNSIQPDELLDGRCHDNLVGHIGSLELNINMKDSTNWNPDRNQFSTPPEKKHSKLGDPVQETVLQIAKIEKEPNNESPQRINEVTHGGQKHKGHERFCNYEATNHLGVSQSEEVEPCMSRVHRSKASRQPLFFIKENEQTSTLDTPKVDESQDTQKSQFLSLGDSKIQIKQMTKKQQDQAPIFRDHELNSLIDISYKLSGTNKGSMDICNPLELKHQKSIKPRKKERLTDGENHLKKILVKSQLFLNTADALFKLDIPISILHASSHDYEDEDGKLTLDCGYELMRRKGKRQEFAAHPCVNISLGFVKIENFDGLIQQLHKDFEILKFYGRSGKQECDAGEYLPRMLQSDVYNSHPELSCMWDLGWNETMFAFIEVDEIVRDIERDVLSGLVHEITRDLLPK